MASFHLATDLLTAIYDGIKSKIFLAVYPVGSVYLSVNQTNPSTLFGGTWARITDGFLYCISGNGGGQGNLQGSAKTAAATGNTGSTTLTVDQMPSHIHGFQMAGTRLDTNGDGQMRMQSAVNAGSGNFWNVSLARIGAGSHNGSMTGTGGDKGHTHTLNSHTHNIPYTSVVVWKRTA